MCRIAWILLSVLLFRATRADAGSSSSIAVVPLPQVIEFREGTFTFHPSTTSFRFSLPDKECVIPAVEEIGATSSTLFGSLPATSGKTKQIIWVGVAGFQRAFDEACRLSGSGPAARIGAEGYTLLVEPDRVLIAAQTCLGAFYGLETLNQLLRGAGPGGRIPSIRIIDWPDLPVRGMMDDISRGPVPTLSTFHEQIRRFAEMKINSLSYYTEDMVRTRSHPDFAPAGAALSIDEWKSLAEFARRYHITLVGNFQSLGHSEHILSHPGYAHLAEGKTLLSPAKAETYELLRDVYREMVPAFDAPYFEINCDEPFELGHGASKRMVDSLGLGRVYVDHVLKLRQFLNDLGVRTMIWGDVLLEHPEMIDRIPRDVLIGTWTYDTLDEYHEYIMPFQSRGFDVMVIPGILNSNRTMPDFRQSFINIERFVRDGIRDNAYGAITTVWDDGGSALFARDWYGVGFAADRMWHCDTADSTYTARVDRALYGDSLQGLSKGVNTLFGIADLTPTDAFNEKIIWSPVLPDSGRVLPLNILEWDSVLAIANAARAALKRGRPLVYKGDIDATEFTAELYAAIARVRIGLVELARRYASVAKGNATDGREDLVAIMAGLGAMRIELMGLLEHLRSLWLAENRLHAMETAEQGFIDLCDGLTDVETRVRSALALLEAGNPVPAPDAVRLSIRESNGWYFNDWLVTNPIPGANDTTDYLLPIGGERETIPRVAQEFSLDGRTVRWKRLSVQTDAGINFEEHYPSSHQATVYAYATIESPVSDTVDALMGIGGRGLLFVNGKEVFAHSGTFTMDALHTRIPLSAGINRVMVKLSDIGTNSWGFSLRLPESTIRHRKNRYTIER